MALLADLAQLLRGRPCRGYHQGIQPMSQHMVDLGIFEDSVTLGGSYEQEEVLLEQRT